MHVVIINGSPRVQKYIYYVDAVNWFPIQIVVTNELDWDIHG